MANAKEELLRVLKHQTKVKCAIITYEPWLKTEGVFTLKVNHSEQDFNDFLNSLDFVYDNGFGSQELYGTVWLEDGTWLSRGEYDGSEWWERNVLPTIPNECL